MHDHEPVPYSVQIAVLMVNLSVKVQVFNNKGGGIGVGGGVGGWVGGCHATRGNVQLLYTIVHTRQARTHARTHTHTHTNRERNSINSVCRYRNGNGEEYQARGKRNGERKKSTHFRHSPFMATFSLEVDT